MTTKLSVLADIRPGYSFRSQILDNPTGNGYIFQQKDVLDHEITVSKKVLFRVNVEKLNKTDKYTLKKDDIIFRARGNPRSVIFQLTDKPVIVASPLIRIRVTSPEITPQYLIWYLNSSEARLYFSRYSKGSDIKYIDAITLGELKIPIVPSNTQRTIAELSTLTTRENILNHELTNKLKTLRNLQIDKFFYQQTNLWVHK